MVYRIFVERSANYTGEAQSLCRDLRCNLRIDSLTGVRLFHRYDVEGIDAEVFERAKRTIFSEPQTDLIYEELPTFGKNGQDSGYRVSARTVRPKGGFRRAVYSTDFSGGETDRENGTYPLS